MPKKKKKPRKHINQPLANFQKVFKKSRRPYNVISSHRKLIPYTNYTEVLDIVASHQKAASLIDTYLVPQETAKIQALRALEPIDLLSELYWVSARIQRNQERISQFLQLSKKVNEGFVSRNYEASLKALEEIDKKVCRSLWAIFKQQAAHQQIGGLDSNKKYTNALIEKDKPAPICKYLINVVSSRNEEAIDIHWLHDNYFSTIENLSIDEELKEYLHYNLYRPLCSFSNYGALLRHASSSSLIDLYETFIFVLSCLIDEGTISQDHLLRLTKQLIGSIEDFRLKKIAYLLTDDVNYIQDFKLLSHESFDLTRANKPFNKENVTHNKKTLGGIHHVINVAKYMLDNDKLPEDEELLDYWKVMEKTDDFYSHYHSILKKSLDAAPIEHEFIVKNFLNMELSQTPLKASDNFDLLEFVYSDYVSPTHFLCLTDQEKKRYFSAFLKTIYNSSMIVNTFSEMSGNKFDEKIKSKTKKDYQVLSAIEQNLNTDIDKCIKSAYLLTQSKNIRMRRYGCRYYAYFLQEKERYKELLEFVGSSLVNDSGSQFTLPLAEIGKLLNKENRRKFANVIDVSIILSFLNKRADNDDDRRLIYAYEDFLRSRKTTKPSELSHEKLKGDELKKLIYFLRHVSTTSVLSNSTIFASNSEVEDERLKIYLMLKDIDPAHIEEYEVDAEEILKKQSIRQVIQHVEKSKIYVDVDKIRAWAYKNLTTNFNRYMSFIKAGIGVTENDTFNDIKIYDKKTKASSIEELLTNELNHESYIIFRDMVRKLMFEFFHNSTYGLDSHLSVNVRHGWVSAKLREPFSKNFIITQKGSNSDKYEKNDKWLKLMSSPEEQTQLNIYLNNFSASVDSIIETLSKEFIQIQSSKHPNGLIYTGLPASFIAALAQEVTSETNFDDFLEDVFNVCWAMTRNSLTKIRTHIDSKVLSELSNAIDQLEHNVQELNKGACLNELQTQIGYARVDVQQAIQSLEDWFSISEGIIHEPVRIDNIINAALTSVTKGMTEDIEPNLIFETNENAFVRDNNISVFNNICFIIFENVLKHSGLTGKFDITVNVSSLNNGIELEISNPISNSVNIRKSNALLKQIRNSIQDGSYVNKISQEGQTGLRKLKQLISTIGNNAEDSLDFGIRKENKTFFVKLKMETKWTHTNA